MSKGKVAGTARPLILGLVLPWAYLPIRNGSQGSFPRSSDALVF